MFAPRKPKPSPGRSLADTLKPRLVASRARTKARMAELRDARALPKQEPVASFLAAVMDCSPFLRSLILDDSGRLVAILASDPTVRLKELTRATAGAWQDTTQPA